ncbi:MAG: hypothetical protein ACYC2T_09505 [Bacillota bacterium]
MFKRELADKCLGWGQRLEPWLVGVVVMGLLLLGAAQLVHIGSSTTGNGLARNINEKVAWWQQEFPEARAVSGKTLATETVTLELVNFSSLQRAVILVNDRPVANFLEKRATISVFPGDVITVDGRFYKHRLKVRVIGVSGRIITPRKNDTIQVDRNTVALDAVRTW